jgi:hypothetical protein
MTDARIIPVDGFKPRSSKGGSKPGRVILNWEDDPEGRLCKIAAQILMEKHDSQNWKTRNFGGKRVMEPLLDGMKRLTPTFYQKLYDHCGGSRNRMLNVLYDRGHKGKYDNKEEGKKRATTGGEHYSRHPKLRDHVEEAKRLFYGII